MHIPKTAGSSVRRMLEAAPPTRGRCCWVDAGDAAAAWDRSPCRERALIAGGHVRWNDIERIAPSTEWGRMTVLRDPIDRLLSLYSFQRARHAAGMLADASPALQREIGSREFADLAMDPRARFFRFTLPMQTLYLGGAGRGFLPIGDGGLDETALAPVLDLALSRLDSLAWIGLTETLDRDLATLAATQAWPPFGPAFRDNPTAAAFRLRRDDIDPLVLDSLRDRLGADYMLLARARAIAAARHHAVSVQAG